jgi:hypothetical protein
MSIQFSTSVRNGRVNAIPTAIGASPYLEIYSGSIPANCAAAATGTLLAKVPMPATYFNAASGGAITMTGTWSESSADGTGTAGYFRIYDNSVSNCHMQGTVTQSGGGGDMIINNTSITAGQQVTVTSFTITDGNS